jgi:hypothetical protein
MSNGEELPLSGQVPHAAGGTNDFMRVAGISLSWLPYTHTRLPGIANCIGAVCNQKTSKFFVSHWEESMAGHVGVKEVHEKLGKESTKGSMVGRR